MLPAHIAGSESGLDIARPHGRQEEQAQRGSNTTVIGKSHSYRPIDGCSLCTPGLSVPNKCLEEA